MWLEKTFMRRNPDLEKRVADLYDDRLHYHNFGHVLRVIDAGARMLEQCREEGVTVDEEAVYYAILIMILSPIVVGP